MAWSFATRVPVAHLWTFSRTTVNLLFAPLVDCIGHTFPGSELPQNRSIKLNAISPITIFFLLEEQES
jgi:hypothetical protein